MARPEPIPFAIGDVVRLRKPHPCGAHDWTVVRLGADIGLTCHGCGRRVLLPRRELERRLKHVVSRDAGDGERIAPIKDGSPSGNDGAAP